MIRVALIDDGVNIKKKNIHHFHNINGNIMEGDSVHSITHGAICYRIFNHFFKEYELFSLKILDENRECEINSLINALIWCKNNNIELINISLGSTLYLDYFRLRDIIEELSRMGIIIVAACNNNNILSYPASISGVIGVKCDSGKLLEAGKIMVNLNDIRDIQVTVGSLEPFFPDEKLKDSNSYVAPYVSALVCDLLTHAKLRYADIMELLQKKGKKSNAIDFIYEKEELKTWFNYEPLVICLKGAKKHKNTVLALQNKLIDREYNTILLSDQYSSKIPFIFNINSFQYLGDVASQEFAYLIMNITKPDIFLITNNIAADSGLLQPDCCIEITDNYTDLPEANKESLLSNSDNMVLDNVIIDKVTKREAYILVNGKKQKINFEQISNNKKETIYVKIAADQLKDDKITEWLEHTFG